MRLKYRVGESVRYRIGHGFGLATVHAVRPDGTYVLLTPAGFYFRRRQEKIRPPRRLP